MDPITFLGVDSSNPDFVRFSNGHVRIMDRNGAIFIDADIVNIFASIDELTESAFEGTLSNITLGSDALNSRFVDELTQDILNGDPFAFFFDSGFVEATNGFSQSATLSSMVEISSGSPVPEPSTVLLFGIGVLSLLTTLEKGRRRSDSKTLETAKGT